jgi:mRNA-degrading endonuclease RelE of RelBE toxin-antitoxin system
LGQQKEYASAMNFRIAGSFTDSLAKLNGEEQKAVKTTAFDLQMDPANPGMQFHRVDGAKDKHFWSVRVSRDVRLIVHKTQSDLLLCYVDHHDAAYKWAERRKLETHPKTGAAQIVEIRETVQEIVVPMYVEAEVQSPPKPLIFSSYGDDVLLGYGVPEEWLPDVKQVTEDTLLDLVDHLPEEASEALLELACGGIPEVGIAQGELQVAEAAAAYPEKSADPFAHPDAQRRFRVMSNVDELKQALDYPWEKWTVFLHPVQRELVERDYSGPARVSGTAGTGKTIVALHRAVFLARKYPDARILLVTFSEALASTLRLKLRRLISSQPSLGERIDVEAMLPLGMRLFERNVKKPDLAGPNEIRELLDNAASKQELCGYSSAFLLAEWDQVIDAWQIDQWERYRDVKRLGRKTRLNEARRKELWTVFDAVQKALNKRGKLTASGLFTRLAQYFGTAKHRPYDFAVVDEAQDLSVAELRFLAAFGADRPNALFFTGDLGQRIFQQPFSWSQLGVNIRGRSRTLRVNYRTSHQIRTQADRLLDPEISDMDGNTEKRTDTVSVFNGPSPIIQTFDNEEEEVNAVSDQLAKWISDGLTPTEIALFVRSENEIDRAKAAVTKAGLNPHVLRDEFESKPGSTSVCTMHLAKGLEFRAVVVMACDDEVIPSQERIEAIGDSADLEDVYNTERHLLYVACTRARDYLMVSSTEPASEFLEDLHSPWICA